MTTPTYELVEFRFENDDGDENNATFDAALNTALSALGTGTGNKRRPRVQILNDNSKVSNVTWQWECNNITASTGWFDITTSSSHVVAVASNSSAVAEGDNLTNRLTSRASFDPDGNITVDGLNNTYNHAAGNYAENSLVFYVVSANVSNGDVIRIRPRSTEGYTVTYTNTPQITVLKATVASQTVTGAITPAGQTVKEADIFPIGKLALTYQSQVLSVARDNLIAYWPLNDTSGSEINELISNNDGTYVGGITLASSTGPDGLPVPFWGVPGQYGNIFSTGLNSVFNGAEGTLSIWFKVTNNTVWSDGVQRRFIFIGADESQNYVAIYKAGTPASSISLVRSGGGTQEFESTGGSIPNTDWMNAVLTWSETNDQVTAWINGSQIFPINGALGTWSGSLSSANCIIGAWNNSAQQRHNGWLSDAAVWNRPLVASEISLLWNNPPDGIVVKEANKTIIGDITTSYQSKVPTVRPEYLVAYWPLHETSGSVAYTVNGGTDMSGIYNGVTLNTNVYTPDGNPVGKWDGVSDYVDIFTVDFDAALNKEIGTLAAWFKMDNQARWSDNTIRRIVSIKADDNNWIVLKKNNTASQIGFNYIAAGTNLGSNFEPDTPSTDWYHFAMTWNLNTDKVAAYVNGAQAGSDITGMGVFSGSLNPNLTLIGATDKTSANPWSGYIGDVAVWSVRLAASEIFTLSQETSHSIVIKQPDKLELAVIPMNYTGTVLSTRRDNLLVYYPLYETSGASADNLEGTAARDAVYHLTALNSSSSIDNRPVPYFGGSLTTDYVDFYSDSLATAINPASMTISMWVKVDNPDVWTDLVEERMISMWGDANNYIHLTQSNSDNIVRLSYAGNGTFDNLNITGLSYTDWFHVAATVDGGNDALRIYINGTEASAEDNLGVWTGGSIVAAQTAIGAENPTGTIPWYGWISDVAIWDRPLTANEISLLYGNPPHSFFDYLKLRVLTALGQISPAGALVKSGLKTLSGYLPLTYFSQVLSTARNSVLAYWPLNETSGSTADNAQGNSTIDGTYTVNTLADLQTKYLEGYAPYFDGSGDWIDLNIVSSSLAIQFNPDLFTITGWMYLQTPDESGVKRTAFRLRSATGINLLWLSKNVDPYSLTFSRTANSNTKNVNYSSAPVGWFHFACTVDVNADEQKLYVNGVQQGGTTSGISAWTGGSLTGNNNVIGAADSTGTESFLGWISDISIWDKVLSSSEIVNLANSPNGVVLKEAQVTENGYLPLSYQSQVLSTRRDSLILYFPLSERSGSVTYDVINSFPGVLNGISASRLQLPSSEVTPDGLPSLHNNGVLDNDGVQVSSSLIDSVFDGNKYTIAAWAKITNSASGWQRNWAGVIRIPGQNGGATELATIAASAEDGFIYFDRRGSGQILTKSKDMSSDEGWHHYATAVDQAASRIDYWVDGASLTPYTSTIELWSGSVTGFALARSYLSLEGYFADAAVWNDTLTDAEVQALYNNPPNGVVVKQPDKVEEGLLPIEYAATVLGTQRDSLIGYWPLTETTGSTAYNLATPEWKGTYSVTTLGSVIGIDGRSTPFLSGASGDFIDIYDFTYVSTLFNASSGTVSLWFKAGSLGDWTDGINRALFYIAVDIDNKIYIRKQASDHDLSFQYDTASGAAGSGGAFATQDITGQREEYEWTHVAMTWDAGADEVRRYISGSLISNAASIGVQFSSGSINPVNFVIGAHNSFGGGDWNGNIAHFALWNTALTDSEIQQLHSGISNAIVVKQPDKVETGYLPLSYRDQFLSVKRDNLLAYWPLNETSGTNADNLEGTAARDGTYSSGINLNNSIGPDKLPVGYWSGSAGEYLDAYSTSLRDSFNGDEGTFIGWGKVESLSVWSDGSVHDLGRLSSTGTQDYIIIRKFSTTSSVRFHYVTDAGGGSEYAKQYTLTGVSTLDWFQMAITWSKTDDEVKLYFNGAQVDDTGSGLNNWIGNLGSNEVVIGANSVSPATEVFQGWLADFSVWDTALTADDIALLYSYPPNRDLVKQPDKIVTGDTTPSGTLLDQISKLTSGTITPISNLIKQADKLLAGTITPTGALSIIKTKLLSIIGSIDPSGDLIKRADKILSGIINLVGVVSNESSGGVTVPHILFDLVRRRISTLLVR